MERISDLISKMTIEEKIGFLHTQQEAVPRLGIKEYNVSAEGAHGLLVRTYYEQWPYGNSTVFPQPMGLSLTWDADLMHRVGDVIGTEARVWYEKDNKTRWLTIWSPTIDMERDPRWGRTEEAYGEDPYLAGKLSTGFIKGVQGEDAFYLKTSCAPKHFYGNNVEKNRLAASTDISERVKREYYLKVFEYAFVEGRAMSLMTAYNEINSIPCIVNPEVLDIVKGEWGCEGYIVCDGDDLAQTVYAHKYCETNAEAIALAMKAGVDCFTDQKHELVIDAATEAYNRKLITEDDIDIAVTNIFKLRFRFGEFDPPEMNPYSSIKEDRLCCREHSDTALEAARKSMVLLKNDGILPLNKDDCGKILLIGDLAEHNLPDWYSGRPPEVITPFDEICSITDKDSIESVRIHDICVIYSKKEKSWLRVDDDGNVFFDGDEKTRTEFEEIDWGFDSVSYREPKSGKYLALPANLELNCKADCVWGWFTQELFLRDESSGDFIPNGHLFGNRYNAEKNAEIANLMSGFKREIISDGIIPALEEAKTADTVILMLGNHPLINGRECFDRPAITFPRRWTELIKRIHAVNPNIVLSLIAGYPFAFPDELELLRAVIYTSHGEQYVGKAVGETLFGINNPAGRTSMTWYLSEDDLPDINDYDIINNPRTYMYFDKPVQFPFGFGLSYTCFGYSGLKIEKSGPEFVVSCKVKNTGEVKGDEVVQLYATMKCVPVKAPLKKLCGFKRIHLTPGEEKEIKFTVPPGEITLFDEKENSFSISPESVIFQIGSSSENIKLSQEEKL